jgi:hypothetical protein
MAYVHCHTCDWSQDDFWDFRFYLRHKGYWWRWGYNPISCFLGYCREYWRPKRTEFDVGCMRENGWARIDPHNWYLLWRCFKSMLRKFRYQTWWTASSWERETRQKCPNCGALNLDVD